MVDFHIDLISNLIPMSKTLYCFTLVELTKLKKYWDELLEKKFIRRLEEPLFYLLNKMIVQ